MSGTDKKNPKKIYPNDKNMIKKQKKIKNILIDKNVLIVN